MHIVAVDPDSAVARLLIGELSASLAAITGDSGQSSFSNDDVRAKGGLFLIAIGEDGDSLGCGGIRRMDEHTGEVKRMYARSASKGVGSAILAALERAAIEMGYSALWLETRRVNHRAVGFYHRRGYRAIPNYGKYIGRADAVCLGKDLR